jgi:DNA-directed RNA polymerase subunit E'/Rpb7
MCASKAPKFPPLPFSTSPLIPIPPSNAAEKVWIWDSEGNELFFDEKEVVRFRVEQELWDANEDRVPYRIIVSLSL